MIQVLKKKNQSSPGVWGLGWSRGQSSKEKGAGNKRGGSANWNENVVFIFMWKQEQKKKEQVHKSSKEAGGK